MIVFYPVAFVVLAQATLSDRWGGCGSGRITPLSLMSGSLEPRTWGVWLQVYSRPPFPESFTESQYRLPRRPQRYPTSRDESARAPSALAHRVVVVSLSYCR